MKNWLEMHFLDQHPNKIISKCHKIRDSVYLVLSILGIGFPVSSDHIMTH